MNDTEILQEYLIKEITYEIYQEERKLININI